IILIYVSILILVYKNPSPSNYIKGKKNTNRIIVMDIKNSIFQIYFLLVIHAFWVIHISSQLILLSKTVFIFFLLFMHSGSFIFLLNLYSCLKLLKITRILILKSGAYNIMDYIAENLQRKFPTMF
ncbi:hypothetical protein L9F63_000169, partial [Diploptera punctata]